MEQSKQIKNEQSLNSEPRRAFKLLRVRGNGSLGPLFINRPLVVVLGEWLEAEFIPTRGFAPRFGWHTSWWPYAPHLSTKDRVWCEVEVREYTEFQRPESQGSTWALAKYMKVLRQLTPEDVEKINLDRPKPKEKPMSDTIKLPKVFFTDHSERDLDTPEVIKETANHFIVSKDDSALPELLSDAEFYVDEYGPNAEGLLGVKTSARATIKALRNAGVTNEPV